MHLFWQTCHDRPRSVETPRTVIDAGRSRISVSVGSMSLLHSRDQVLT